jgi:RND family efflux transporter MFP subunit
MSVLKSLFCIIIFFVVSASSAIAQVPIEAITKPSADVTISFVQPGTISNVLLKEGDHVKAGQVLVQQDDQVAQAQLAQIKAQSDNIAEIEAGKASLEQKKLDLKKLEWAAKRGAATEQEVAHSKLAVKIAELSLQIAEFDHAQNIRKYDEAKIRVKNMKITSPLDGVIEKVSVEVGESVNGLEEVVRVVKVDTLWIDVHVPLARAKKLKKDQSVTIKFPRNEHTTQGLVIFVGAVADAASGTLRIKIEVPNQTNRPAGEHVSAIFPD